jgi:SAM-dependent methyltransferase
MGEPGLLDVFPAAGRALDVACGRGGVAVWLAGRGLSVDAVDVSPVGLAAGARLAAAHGVGDRIRWIEHDLDLGLPSGCSGPYDVVVCQLFRDPARYGDLAAALARGGLLVVSVLSEVGAGPGPFRAPPGELRAAFSGLEILLDRESDGEASLLARSHGSRPAPPPPS